MGIMALALGWLSKIVKLPFIKPLLFVSTIGLGISTGWLWLETNVLERNIEHIQEEASELRQRLSVSEDNVHELRQAIAEENRAVEEAKKKAEKDVSERAKAAKAVLSAPLPVYKNSSVEGLNKWLTD